ncbi:hypothetical protein N2152v2_001217 [Parachlorella kessleri]
MAAVQHCAASLASPQAVCTATVRRTAPANGRFSVVRPSYNARRSILCAAGTGGNVLDRPSTLPGLGKGKEVKPRKPPIYRVLLHNDNYNRREYVVQVLLKVVEGFTPDEAVNEAHINGLALVTMCAQEMAEVYVESMRLNGLIATLEPAGK